MGLLFQSDDSPSNSIVVHCGDDSNSAEDQGLNAGEERPLPPVSSSPITAKVRLYIIKHSYWSCLWTEAIWPLTQKSINWNWRVLVHIYYRVIATFISVISMCPILPSTHIKTTECSAMDSTFYEIFYEILVVKNKHWFKINITLTCAMQFDMQWNDFSKENIYLMMAVYSRNMS
jgi:hypothetical protein